MKYDKDQSGKKAAVREQSLAYSAKVDMKRLTIDVPAPLHSAIKVACAQRGVKMADAIREILRSEFGEDR